MRLGKEDNFWELTIGPSGPCSEIFVDRGEEHGCGDPNCKPGCDCDRFIEVWNLVFTQFDKDEDGNYNRLKHPNIDTGMGLERIATVLQDTQNIFEIDAIDDILKKVAAFANYEYGTDKKLDESIRVITDHIRAVTFMVSDSIIPSNEGRGYVLRRLIRRAARHGRLLGIKEAFLYKISENVIDSWSVEYEELAQNREMIKNVILKEEERFLLTLEEGMGRLNDEIKALKSEGKKILSGEDAFKLYDTYGFPLDLTEEILREQGFEVDHDGFKEAMIEQRDRARNAQAGEENIGWGHTSENDLLNKFDATEFVGYECDQVEAKIEAIIKDQELVESLAEGEEAYVIIQPTPFYPEGGGQVGEKGQISSDKLVLEVLDTKTVAKDKIISKVKVLEGMASLESVTAEVDRKQRALTRRNHSVTHLVHEALRRVLGEHVTQAGSLVNSEMMRFDFTHYEGVTREQIGLVEELVNEEILNALPVNIEYMSLKDAQSAGAIGLFEDKYQEHVRVVSMGEFSKELCGGLHVNNTSEIGVFKILSESGISAGVRRIECVTSLGVLNHLNELLKERNSVADMLKANSSNYMDQLSRRLKELASAKKSLDEMRHELAKDAGKDLIDQVKTIKDINYIAARMDGVDVAELRNMAEQARDKMGSGVVLLGAVQEDGKVNFVTAASKDYIARGIKAGDIVREIAKIASGGGGGRPDMATAGGKDATKIEDALNYLKELLSSLE